ncbi:calmodulin-like protein [Perkinsela sp. CCAP 1560/4]|nr:calmodulin-like protein [Perkinsela sp. CCAP 1560/4]|eukprot:KNH08203.1 calmodulin-like protein [Perkinsela sp. CCAP 1560/4]
MSKSPKIGHERVAELKEAFRCFDKADSGTLCPEELISKLRTIGLHPDEADEINFLENVQSDSKSRLDFPTFACLMGQNLKSPELRRLLSRSLEIIESEMGAEVSTNELDRILATHGKPLPKSSIPQNQSLDGSSHASEVFFKSFGL